jgi:uncharacterized membrane protein YbaN (DUF454 family)
MSTREDRTRRIETALFLIPFVSYAYFYQGADQSTAARFDQMRAAIEKHALWIDGFAGYNTADIINFAGHIYSVKAPGTSLVALVPWWLITHWLAPLASRNDPLYWAIATYLTIVVTTGLAVSLLAVVMYRFARFLGCTQGRSAALALVLAFGTIMFPYATEMTGEPLAGVFSFIAFYLVATFDTAPSRWRAFGAGLLAGLAVLNDYPAFVIAAAIGIYALVKLWRRLDRVAIFAAGAATAAALLLGYNWGAFGSPLFFSYQAFKLPGNTQFPEQARGFVGLTYPKIRNLWNILVDPQRGLFFCNPVLLLAIPGTGYFFAHRRWRAEWAVAAFAFVAMILFNASYGESIVSWGGGTATGPRQIVAAIPFMVLMLAMLPAACDWLIGALAVVSVFIMLIATSTNPHFPYEYENPVRDFALQQYLRGDFATNRDAYYGGGLITPDSVAFNLGQLLRLPRSAQLWPLGAFWILGALELGDLLGIFERPAVRNTGPLAVALGVAVMFLASLDGAIAEPLALRAHHGLLGRYFVGERAGQTPPHIVRIDRQINFDHVAEMGAMPFPSVALWTGRLIAPATGAYIFIVDADDAGWLDIDGRVVIADPGPVNHPHGEAALYLTAGVHRIVVGERNIGGDAAIHFIWQPPGRRGEVVPAAALIPDRP